MKLKAALVSTVLFLLVAPAAQASELLFTIAGVDNATFTLDSAPTPDGFFNNGAGDNPYFDNINGTLSGSSFQFPVITFYGASNSGGVTGGTEPGIVGTVYFDLYGPTIFSGTPANPTFAPGVFDLNNIAGVFTDTLTISGVPEPATWGLMLAGFFGLGAVVRAARRKVITA